MTNKTCIKFCELSFGGMRLLLCLLLKTLGVIDILDEDGGDDCRVQPYWQPGISFNDLVRKLNQWSRASDVQSASHSVWLFGVYWGAGFGTDCLATIYVKYQIRSLWKSFRELLAPSWFNNSSRSQCTDFLHKFMVMQGIWHLGVGVGWVWLKENQRQCGQWQAWKVVRKQF